MKVFRVIDEDFDFFFVVFCCSSFEDFCIVLRFIFEVDVKFLFGFLKEDSE